MNRFDQTVPDLVPVSSNNSLQSCRLFQGFDDFKKIAVAVSGGSDSLALLHLLNDWTRSRGKQLTALTVDHQLRVSAQDEAAYVGLVCEQMGVEHHILHWSDDKPATGLQSAARTARYDLMAAHCSRSQIQGLALGHTLDDQAETILMRLTRTDEQNRGLSGMAPTTLFAPDPNGHITLCRPLLEISRADLRTYLSNHNVEWMDDPSNQDQHYERVRVRSYLADQPALSRRLIDYAAVHARWRGKMALDAARFIERYCSLSDFDCVHIERPKLFEQPSPVAVLIVQVLLSVVGGRDHLPPAIKVLGALRNCEASTLARVHISHNQAQLILCREERNLPAVMQLKSEPTLWDQRFWLTANDETSHDVEVFSGHDFMGDLEEFICEEDNELYLRITSFDKRALASMPFGRICAKGNKSEDFIMRSAKGQKELRLVRAFGAFDRYCTQFDFPIRRALESLFTV